MTEKKNLSSALAKRDKKEKYIIYFVGAAVLLFVLVGLKEISQSNPYLSAPVWFGFFGAIFTLWRFCKKQKENPFASIFRTLKDDYVFDRYNAAAVQHFLCYRSRSRSRSWIWILRRLGSCFDI